jgi:hypothetical protein
VVAEVRGGDTKLLEPNLSGGLNQSFMAAAEGAKTIFSHVIQITEWQKVCLWANKEERSLVCLWI